MKKILQLMLISLLNINIINLLVACDIVLIKKKNNENEEKIIIPQNFNERKWYNFLKKIGQIAFDYYSVETEVVAQTFENMCDIGDKNDICWVDLLEKLGINEKMPYWKIERKILEYKEIKKEYSFLPNIDNKFKININRIFKTIEFWIIYRIFWADEHKEQQFINIFDLTIPYDKNNTKIIIIDNDKITKLFNINWEYKTRKEDSITKGKWIESYNENTQIKLFEIISYYKYVENLFEKEINDYQSKGYDQKINYMKLIEYEHYINMEKYQKWINENQNKPGYGVWQEMDNLLIN